MDDIIFEINQRDLLGIALLIAFLFIPIGISLFPYKGDPAKPPLFDRLQARMGLGGLNSGLLFVAIALWGVIFVSLVMGLLGVVWSFILSPIPQGQAQIWDWRFSLAKMAALTATLGAVVALPFTLIRLAFTQRQTLATEEGLITDRISKAVEGLGAEKTVKKDGEESTTPNLEVRIGAIYALERIAQDSDRDHIQIMEILCTYIRENAPLRETPENPFEVWQAGEADNIEDKEMPEWSKMWTWARTLQRPRTDIQVALEVIGRRKPRQIKIERDATVRDSKVGYRLDLRSTCLQGADLSELDFMNGLFGAAQLQGTNFRKTQLQGAVLIEAQLQGANLIGAQLQGADLSWARLQGANLYGAQLQRTDLDEAQLQGADLRGTQLQGAFLGEAQLQGADLSEAQLQGADLSEVQLQGADLSEAQLQGADLSEVQFDRSTSLTAATFQGAAAKEVDLTDITIKQDQIITMFGDATVTLPGGHGPDHESWPEHWSKEELAWPDFLTHWRAFQRSIGQDPDNPA